MKIEDIFKLEGYEVDEYVLKSLSLEDVQGIYGIYSDPACLNYQTAEPMKKMEEAERFVENARFGEEKGMFVKWGLHKKNKKGLIGIISIHHIDRINQSCQLGYILLRSAWNQGITTIVLKALSEALLNPEGFVRLVLSIHPDNKASIKVGEKCGFLYEGQMKKYVYNPSQKRYEDRVVLGKIRKNEEGLLW